MPRMPRAIRLAMPDALALRFAARPLTTTYAHVRLEPPSAYATRTLLAHSARDDRPTTPSSPTTWSPTAAIADHVLIANHAAIAAVPPTTSVGHF